MVFDGLGRVWEQFLMLSARFLADSGWISLVLETRDRSGGSGSRFVSTCEANFWILDASVATFGQHIMDLGGRRGAPGVGGGCFGFDFGPKIEMITRTIGIQESMLSPAWEHGFPMVCRCF